MMVPFGPYAPDKPARLNDGIVRTASGVYPMPDGYRPIGQWAQIISALPAAPRGGASFTSPQGVSSIIAGTSTALYRGLTGGFTSIGTGYSLQDNGRWRFAQFGGLAIATNGADAMQKIDLADFTVSVLGGSPPKFEMLAVVKDFLVGGVMNGNIQALAWSAINNAEGWTFGTDQSDYQIMPSGGKITGILSGEFGVILQRSRICRMDYVGGNTIFEINEVSSNIGCVSVHTVAQWGRLGFFWSDQGPMMWDGSQIVPIGEEVITRTIQSLYDKDDWPSISTAIDPINGVVIWALPDQMIGYNWKIPEGGRWFTVPYVSPIIFGGVTRDISIDEQDPAVGATDDDVDGAALVSLDDPSFRGGDPRLYVFNGSYALGAFTGTPMAATITLGDLEMFKGRRADMRWVRPETDAVSGMTLTLSYKQRLGDSLTNDSYTSLTTSGDMPVRTSGRYVRPKLVYAAGTTWTYAKGLDLTAKIGAGR
jgi:hypothetical protein